MKKVLTATVCSACLFFASSALATSIFYEATNVKGVGEVKYGYTATTVYDAPEFLFKGSDGDVDYDFSSFVPGEYTLSVTLEGFWADFNEDGNADFTLADESRTSDPFMLSGLPPLSGTVGQLSWNVDLNAGGWVSYDFGNTGLTNFDVNTYLAKIDGAYSGAVNGVMDANIGWDKLRVELNSTAPVPEPATMLLFGTGLLGLIGYNRKRLSKK